MYMQRQYTIRINAESRDFWAQFSVDQSFLLLFKIVTFYSNDIDGSECSDAKQKLQAEIIKEVFKEDKTCSLFAQKIPFIKFPTWS